jgi:hypothetical protein
MAVRKENGKTKKPPQGRPLPNPRNPVKSRRTNIKGTGPSRGR